MFCWKKKKTIFLPLIQSWPSFKILVAESSKASNTCAMMILNKGQKCWFAPLPPPKKNHHQKCFRLLEKGHHVISNLHVLETSAIYTKLCYGHSFEKVITEMNACVNLKVTICPGGEWVNYLPQTLVCVMTIVSLKWILQKAHRCTPHHDNLPQREVWTN